LSFDRHVSIVSASSFYWLRQLQRSRRSLDTESAATLVHSFVASRIDYCNAVLAGAPKATTNKLQRVLNATARVVSGVCGRFPDSHFPGQTIPGQDVSRTDVSRTRRFPDRRFPDKTIPGQTFPGQYVFEAPFYSRWRSASTV